MSCYITDFVAIRLNSRLETLEKDAVTLTKKVQSLEAKVELLESEADKREKYKRRQNLRFSAIAEAANESTTN